MKVYNTHINFLKLSGIETLWKWADSVPIFKSLFWMHTFLQCMMYYVRYITLYLCALWEDHAFFSLLFFFFFKVEETREHDWLKVNAETYIHFERIQSHGWTPFWPPQ